jgi:conjugal transfer/entry exclusion protein
MKMRKLILITCALVFGIAAPAAALVPIPDMCAFGGCITFTHTTALAQIESLYNQATMLSNEARNLNTVGNVARQAITENIGGIIGSGTSVSPLSVGDNAAQQTVTQAAGSAQAISKVDSLAQSADGAQQQAQVSNLYLSTIADESVKANTLSAETQVQHQNQTSSEIAGLHKLFSGQEPANEQL